MVELWGEIVSGSECNDQEDVFDCNVDGPALAAVGRALGLHTEDPATPLDADLDSGSDDGDDGGVREGAMKRLSQQHLAGKDSEKEGGPAEGRSGAGMALSDLVWW